MPGRKMRMAAQEHESLYSDSVCSSPRSVGGARGHDEEPRVRFMCSHGGRILPRPHDSQLRYVGGDTRIVAVSRAIAYSVLIAKLSKLCGSNVTIKYQLPNEDLDALISVTTDEDLENMMEEYDRLNGGNRSSSARLRLFLFPAKLENASSLGSLLEGSKREHWFVDALNGLPLLTSRLSEVSSLASEVPDYLFGLDTVDDWDREDRPGPGKSRLNSQSAADAQSAPGSPVPTSSPYGSTSSIDTHVVAELAAKARKSGLHPAAAPEIGTRTQNPGPAVEDRKPVFKADPLKNSEFPPDVPRYEPQEPPRVAKQEAPVEVGVRPEQTGSEPMGGTGASLATMKRVGSPSIVSARGDEAGPPDAGPVKTDEVLAPGVTTRQAHHYVEYTPQFVQPAAYWQMQEDAAGQVYYVAAGAAPAVQRQPAYMPVQRMPSTIPYGTDMGSAGFVTKSPRKAPLYRAPRPVPATMMRPPVPSSDQYRYHQVGYEAANAQQMYYTQKPAVMNPQYQPMMGPVALDLQASAETISEGAVLGRVTGSV